MNTANPYIGPRVFQRDEGHLFFGRSREAADLTGLVISEPLLLFYAQSGAGKSSLISARIIPELEADDVEVLPVGRVSGDPPQDLEPRNIYLYNLERKLVQHDIDLEALSRLSLTKLLAGLDRDEQGYFFTETPKPALSEEEDMPRRRVLIIDQFEEFFSTHPEAWSQREGFFRELAQAMKDHHALSIVLIMREDYVASLDPYAHLLPGGMRMRYYMQRLSWEAALAAIKSPVSDIRPYAPGVAERLVDDLCRIVVQKPDGTLDTMPGQYVESVQLQVVCYSLWQNLPAEGNEITEKDLMDVGDVNQSLGRYYAERVSTVAQKKQVKERVIRDWFEHKLITPGGLRNLVLQEPSQASGGLDDGVIQEFLSDLVRAEKRGGATFYELTHDRLVEPILADNKQWFELNLSPLQRQALLWEDQGRNDNWLLQGQAYREVLPWVDEHRDELTGPEMEFLEASREQRYQQLQSARQTRRFTVAITTIAAVALVLLVLAIISTTNANAAKRDASNQASIALALCTFIFGYILGRYRTR